MVERFPSIICDVDGCLVPPRKEPWDFQGLARLADKIAEKRFSFTLCSGRPATFLEALARQLILEQHCICENGALLFHPLTKQALIHPNIPKEYLAEQGNIRAILQELIAGTPMVIELGKDIMFSVNSSDKSILDELCEQVQEKLAGAPVVVVNSSRSVEVIPKGVNKAAGLEFWAEVEGIDIANTLSIGDADNDLEILRAAGRAAAPGNCTDNVRQTVDYVAQEPMVQGVLEICDKAQELVFGN
ncbi:MAG: HAD family hydrolase [Limnochordia bacterium]|jgi:HAD superfamily hydrolase (TIGR01484 family)